MSLTVVTISSAGCIGPCYPISTQVARANFPAYIDPNIPSSRPYCSVPEPIVLVSKPVAWVVGELVLGPWVDRIHRYASSAFGVAKSAAIRFDRAFSFPVAQAVELDPLMQLDWQLLEQAAGLRKGPPPMILDTMAEVHPEDGGIAALDEEMSKVEEALKTDRALLAKDPTNAELLAAIEKNEGSLKGMQEIRTAVLQRQSGPEL